MSVDLSARNRERIEDLEWLAETGESASGAAMRLGMRRTSVSKLLGLAGRHDLWAQLQANETRPSWSGMPSGVLMQM